MRAALAMTLLAALWPSSASAQLTIELKDYVTMPMTGVTEGKGSNEVLLARVNAVREEPGGANRFFVADLNGPLYILDKTTRKLATYLNFDCREGHSGIFPRFFITSGYGNGLNGFYFDPDYRRNGKFYTVHMEDPSLPILNA